MGFVTKRGGGGGGDDGSGDELLGETFRRCSTCRRELHPWESVCPDDGGEAVEPGAIEAGHDALLARLLADDPDLADDDAADDADGDAPDGEPTWPSRTDDAQDT